MKIKEAIKFDKDELGRDIFYKYTFDGNEVKVSPYRLNPKGNYDSRTWKDGQRLTPNEQKEYLQWLIENNKERIDDLLQLRRQKFDNQIDALQLEIDNAEKALAKYGSAVDESLTEGKQDIENFKKWIEETPDSPARYMSGGNKEAYVNNFVNTFNEERKNLKAPYNDYYYWIKQNDWNAFTKMIADQGEKKASKQREKDGAKLIYSDNDWKVYEITTYEASVKYGANTKWCISGSKRWTNGRSGMKFWDDYTKEGVKFYFFINKDTKYALALYHNGKDFEIFDAQDNAISYIPNAPIIDSIPVDYYTKNDDRLLMNLIKTGKLPNICEIISSYLLELDEYVDIFPKSEFQTFLDTVENNINQEWVRWRAVEDGIITKEQYKEETGEEWDDYWGGDTTMYMGSDLSFLDGYATVSDAMTKDNPYFGYDKNNYFISDLYNGEVDCREDWVGVWLYIRYNTHMEEDELLEYTKRYIRYKNLVDTYEELGLSRDYLLGESIEEHLGANVEEEYANNIDKDILNTIKHPLDKLHKDTKCSQSAGTYLEYYFNNTNKPLKLCLGNITPKNDKETSKSITHVWVEVDGDIKETHLPPIDFRREVVDELVLDRNKDLYTQVEEFLNKPSLREDLSQEVDSEGNPLSKEQVEFFRNSKVRDTDGTLLLVYHGSKSHFTTFDKSKIKPWGWYGKGFYFTPSPNIASTYSEGYTLKCYLNITNPFYADSSFTSKEEYYNRCDKLYELVGITKEEVDKQDEECSYTSDPYYKLLMYLQHTKATRDINDYVKELGYDGVIGLDTEGEYQEIVALEPNQIKSIGNKAPSTSDNINEQLLEMDLSKIKDIEDGIPTKPTPTYNEASGIKTYTFDGTYQPQYVEEYTRRGILTYIMDNYINNKDYMSDDMTLYVEYNDGSTYYLSNNYEEGKFKKNGIKRVIEDNGSTYSVYGDWTPRYEGGALFIEGLEKKPLWEEKNTIEFLYHGSPSPTLNLERDSTLWLAEDYGYAMMYGDYLHICSAHISNILEVGSTDGYIRGLIPTQFSPKFTEMAKMLTMQPKDLLKACGEDCKNIYSLVRTKQFRKICMDKGYDAVETEEFGNVCYGVFNRHNVELVDTEDKEDEPTPMNESKLDYIKCDKQVGTRFTGERLSRMLKEALTTKD